MAWKEYCAEYWLKELQKSMDSCDIPEILFKTALNTVQSTKLCLEDIGGVLRSNTSDKEVGSKRNEGKK